MTPVNYKDILFKWFWTVANVGVAAAIVEVGDLEVWWGALALSFLQIASTYVRQQLGATPPEAPAVGPLAVGKPSS